MQDSAAFRVRGGAPEADILQFWVEQATDGAIVHARGEIDLWTAPALRDRLDQLLRRGLHVVLDLSDISYFDISGVEALEDALEAFGARTRLLILASPSSIVTRVLSILNIQDFATLPTVAEAQRFLRERTS